MTGDGLYGSYYVKPTATALTQAWTLCQKSAREYNILRRHTLKLAFWPDGSDSNWDWIKTLEPQKIGELRIDDEVAGHNNVRIIFFKSNIALSGDPVAASGERAGSCPRGAARHAAVSAPEGVAPGASMNRYDQETTRGQVRLSS